MSLSYQVINLIYRRNILLKPILSDLSGVVESITPDILGFKVVVRGGAGELSEYSNLQVLNVILYERVRDAHLIGYILKG